MASMWLSPSTPTIPWVTMFPCTPAGSCCAPIRLGGCRVRERCSVQACCHVAGTGWPEGPLQDVRRCSVQACCHGSLGGMSRPAPVAAAVWALGGMSAAQL
eukprot:561994-Heterocapsa_arctica.AAC.1